VAIADSRRPPAEGSRRTSAGRARDSLLVALAASSGAVDAISWLSLGKVFSAFMTGNIAFLGFGIAGAQAPSPVRTSMALAFFAAGAAVGGRIASGTPAHATWSPRVTTTLCLAAVAQVVFLGLWVIVDGRPSSLSAHALIAVSAFAMGMQTAAVFALGVRAVFTTAATATWAALMGDLSDWSRSHTERRRRRGGVDPLRARRLRLRTGEGAP
jgi:uncharacterized membrane protein YoaK (UPF0700 family)